MGRTHLVPDRIFLALLSIVLVEVDNVHDSLRVLLLLFLCDAILLQHALPFLGETLDTVSEWSRVQRGSWRGTEGEGEGEWE
jgi:hypothetical protein